MERPIIYFLLLSVPAFGLVNSEVITSPPETNWGDWAETFDRCPDGLYVQGFQLLTEEWSIIPGFDDTSLNGIKLFCGNPHNGGAPSVTSSVGNWGRWGNLYRCYDLGYINGFQLRVEAPSILPGHDSTATNNVRVFCTKVDADGESFIQGDGERWGHWSESQFCSGQKVVCGIRTQVQTPRAGLGDDTALNNVAMECCDPPPTQQ